MKTLTCRTEGCSKADVPVLLDLAPVDFDTGETVLVDLANVTCGACGQPITDIMTLTVEA